MLDQYESYAKIFKVLSDPSRLKIIEILSCGERCACDIQTYFDFTQPTLSHHMKLLIESGLVASRKVGIWNYYSLNNEEGTKLMAYFNYLISDTSDCLCHEISDSSQPCIK